MHKTLNLIGKIVCYAFMAIGLVFCVLMIAKSAAIKTDVSLQNSIVVPAIIIAIIATIFCIFVALIFPLFFTTYSKKKLISAGLVLLIFVVLFALAWIMPDAKLPLEFLEEAKITEQVSKWVGVGCYLAYFTFAGAVIAIIYSAIMGLVKNK